MGGISEREHAAYFGQSRGAILKAREPVGWALQRRVD